LDEKIDSFLKFLKSVSEERRMSDEMMEIVQD